MQTDTRIPVTVLSGFLGSGKTTVLNGWLREPRFKDTAVIVNELGDIGIDHLLVASSTDNIVLLESGCICCAQLESLKETLADLYYRRTRAEIPNFSRVLVETTGLADPAPLLQILLRNSFVAHFFRLAGLITTVDALFGERQLTEHGESVKQVALADQLIVTKTDLTANACPALLRDRLRDLNPLVPIHCGSVADAVLVDVLMGCDAPARSMEALRDTQLFVPRHDARIRSQSFVIEASIGWAGLAAWVDLVREFFGARLLRCKGLLLINETGGPVLVQGVQTVFATPQRLHDWPSDDHRSRLVCITRDIDSELLQASLGVLHAEPGTYRPASLEELLATVTSQLPANGNHLQ